MSPPHERSGEANPRIVFAPLLVPTLGLVLGLEGCRSLEIPSQAPPHDPAAAPTPSSDAAARDRYVFTRRYVPGAVHRYRISRSYFENGQLKRTEEAISVHTVLAGSPPHEQIGFQHLVTTQGDERRDLSEEIERFPPYRVSLAKDSPETGLDAPSLAGWSMHVVGIVTDLHTFLVAISPQVGIEHVVEPGQSYEVPEPVTASWANDADVLVGRDCIEITITLTELREHTAVFETRFTPPAERCLEPLTARMSEPVVAGTPNNFQQKSLMGDQLGAMWGHERFVVVSEVRRSDGVLLEATMTNELQLQMALMCTEELEPCRHEAPLTLRRELTVSLLDEHIP